MAFLEIESLKKSFGAVDILKGIDLTLDKGGFLVLVGPSGCGKSTLLNTIAGLESISSGDIRVEGRSIASLHPSKRDIAMVFQSYALYPNMTVAQNIAFAMEMRGVPRPEREAAVAKAAKTLQITHLLDRKPSQLSGGQRQRVAMGRALVREPKLFLFDEPLSNLDAKLRVDMRIEIKRLHHATGTTIVYVTHDQIEAMTLATKIAVLKDGVLQQVGSPSEIYNRPSNVFVADFMGSPAMNLLPARLKRSGSQRAAMIESGTVIQLPDAFGGEEGQEVLLGIRPEHLSVGEEAGGLSGRVALVEPMGGQVQIVFEIAGRRVTVLLNERILPVLGSELSLRARPAALHAFDAASGRRL